MIECVCILYCLQNQSVATKTVYSTNRTQIKGSQQVSQHMKTKWMLSSAVPPSRRPFPLPATHHCRLWRKSPGHELAWNWVAWRELWFTTSWSPVGPSWLSWFSSDDIRELWVTLFCGCIQLVIRGSKSTQIARLAALLRMHVWNIYVSYR